MPWYEAVDQPGAWQMQFGRRLMESRPFLTRIPDDSVIVPDEVKTSVPGSGRYRFVATRDENGRYAMVYVPVGRPFTVRMDVVSGKKVTAWWYNPRNGKAQKIGNFSNEGTRTFVPPQLGENSDWINEIKYYDDSVNYFPFSVNFTFRCFRFYHKLIHYPINTNTTGKCKCHCNASKKYTCGIAIKRFE